GELTHAEEMYTIAIASAEVAEDEGLVAEGYLRRGDVFSRQGKWEVCENDLEQSRKIYRKLNEHVSVGRIDNIAGTNYAIQGRMKQAQTYYRRALGSFERYNDVRMTGTVLMNLGIVYNILGQYDEALSQYQRALSFFEKIGDRQRLAELHHNMGMSYLFKGEYKQSLSEFNRVSALVNPESNVNLTGLATLGKANACFYMKDLRMALSFVHHALSCFTASNDRLSIADCYKVKGMIHREMKKFSFASSYFQTSLRINIELKNQLNAGETYYELGVLEVMKKQPAEAKKAFVRAIECFKAVGARQDVERAEKMLKTIKTARK
ncbi:MAG: tetratricopeptide repeat protein, partial [bacterium]